MIRYFLISILLCTTTVACSQQPTVRQVMDGVMDELNIEAYPNSVDTLKSGSWDVKVTGIATTFMATMKVLKEAKSQGANLIFTHEPTYYNHRDFQDDFGRDDPIVNAKRKYIDDNGLVIFRFHDLPHRAKEDMINRGMIDALGWEKYHNGDMVFDAPAATVGDLAELLKKHFKTTTVRVVGDPKMKLKKVGMLPGAYGRHAQVKAFNNDQIDALIIGEASEWEAIEYARDAQELGWKRALIVMGHADSEESGMIYTADWLKGLFPKMKISFIAAGNPLWSPE